VIAVDLESGDRSEISGAAVGTGPLLKYDPTALAIDENGILLVTGEGEDGIDTLFAVELESGGRIAIFR